MKGKWREKVCVYRKKNLVLFFCLLQGKSLTVCVEMFFFPFGIENTTKCTWIWIMVYFLNFVFVFIFNERKRIIMMNERLNILCEQQLLLAMMIHDGMKNRKWQIWFNFIIERIHDRLFHIPDYFSFFMLLFLRFVWCR